MLGPSGHLRPEAALRFPELKTAYEHISTCSEGLGVSFSRLGQTKASALSEPRRAFTPDEHVSKAAGLMLETGQYEVFVVTRGRVLFLTTRDALGVSDPNGEKLGTVASVSPRLSESDTVARAAGLLFEHRLRALPVAVKEDSVMAVTAAGIAEKMAAEVLGPLKVKDLMTLSPVTVEASSSADAAKELMLKRSFDHLPVVKNGRLAGMLTSTDLLRRMLPSEGIPKGFRGVEQRKFDYPVSRVAGDSVVQTDPAASAKEAVEMMLRERVSYVVAGSNGQVEGIMTLRDVLRPLVPPVRSEPPVYIVGLPDRPFEAEAAKEKLFALSKALMKAFPFIEEIRAVVKTKGVTRQRSRYEVTVSVYSPKEVHAYSGEGYDLADIFDEIAPKLKRLLGSRQSRVTSTHGAAERKRGSPE